MQNLVENERVTGTGGRSLHKWIKHNRPERDGNIHIYTFKKVMVINL